MPIRYFFSILLLLSMQTVSAQSPPNNGIPLYQQASAQSTELPQGAELPLGVREHVVPRHGDVPASGWTKVGSAGQIQPVASQQLLLPPNFPLTPEQEDAVNRFLVAWEQFGTKIKRFESNFDCYSYSAGESLDRAKIDPNVPTFIVYGSFRYIEPNKINYEVEGEIVGKEKVKGKRPEKFVCNGKSFFYYEFGTSPKKVIELPLPAEQQKEGLMSGPLPFVFGAKATEMKSRYFVRLMTPEPVRGKEIWLEAWPKWAEDAAEYRFVQLILHADTFMPKAIRKFKVNEKGNDVYVFHNPKASEKATSVADVFNKLFDPIIPADWVHEIDKRLLEESVAARTPIARPITTPVVAQPQGRIPLYQSPQ